VAAGALDRLGRVVRGARPKEVVAARSPNTAARDGLPACARHHFAARKKNGPAHGRCLLAPRSLSLARARASQSIEAIIKRGPTRRAQTPPVTPRSTAHEHVRGPSYFDKEEDRTIDETINN